MAQKKLQAVAELLIETKDTDSKVDKLVSNIMQKLKNIETAADKMTAFQDLAGYIGKIDNALGVLKEKNADTFNHMFDGLDVNLRKKIEEIFGISGLQLDQFDILNEKLGTLNIKSSIADVRAFATAINELYTGVGAQAPLNIDEFTNTRTTKKHIDDITAAITNFATIWKDVNTKVAGGFGAGAPGSGSGGPSEAIQAEIDKLNKQKKEYQEIIDVINGKKIKLNVDETNDKDKLKDLRRELQSAKQEMDKLAGERVGAGDEQYKQNIEKQYKIAVAKYTRLASLFKNTYLDIVDNGSNAGQQYALDSDVLASYDEVDKYLQQFYKKQKHVAEQIKQIYTGLMSDIDVKITNLQTPTGQGGSGGDLEGFIQLYETLRQKVQEYNQIAQRINSPDIDDSELANLQNRLDNIATEIENIRSLSNVEIKSVGDILGNLEYGDLDVTEAVKQLCHLLYNDVPKGAEKLNSAIGEAAENAQTKVDNLKKSLSDLLTKGSQMQVDVAQGKSTGKEHMQLFGDDGVVSTVGGQGYSVDTDALAGQLITNLKKNIIMSLHNHPDGMSFSPSDLQSFAELYYGQGTKMHGIIADGFIKTIDFTGISQEVAKKIAKSYSDNLSELSSKYAEYFTIEDGNIKLSENVSRYRTEQPEKYNQIMETINDLVDAAINDAFTKNGLESTLKGFSESDLQNLAQYLVEIQKNSNNAIAPVEKLKNLIAALHPNRDFDWSKYTEIFKQFEDGAIDGTKAINQILDLKTVTQTSTENTKIQETIDLLKKKRLAYEDVLALVKAYNDDEAINAAAEAKDWETYDKLIALKTEIAKKLVPTEMMGIGNDSPDKWLSLVGIAAEEAARKLSELYDLRHNADDLNDSLGTKDLSGSLNELYKYIEEANKAEKKISDITLGKTDGDTILGRNVIDIIKDKQKALKEYLNELVKLNELEKKDGMLSGDDLNRKKDLISQIRDLQLGVRYKDGSNYSTYGFGDYNEDLEEQIANLNQIISLRKKIDFGFYGTNIYGTYNDTFSGDKMQELVESGIGAFGYDPEAFNASVIGQLIREYQELHHEMLNCMLVGDEVPASTMERLKWFETLDSTKLNEIVPKLEKLHGQMKELSGEVRLTEPIEYGKDESYYDNRIQKLQQLIDVQKEYEALGGSKDETRYTMGDLEKHFGDLTQAKNGLEDVKQLKQELTGLFGEDFNKNGDYNRVFADLQSGWYNYAEAMQESKRLYEKNNPLAEQISKIKQIAKAYDDLADAQSVGTERQEEQAQEKIDAFENQYYGLIATMKDGSKIQLPLGDEFSEMSEKMLKSAQQIQNIEFIPRSAEGAIQAYEQLDKVFASLNTRWKDPGTLERAVNSFDIKDIELTKGYLQSAIDNIKLGDPEFQFGSQEKLQQAVQTLEKLEVLSKRINLTNLFTAATPDSESIEWTEKLEAAFTEVLQGIRNGTYTTVEECIARFNELSSVASQSMEATAPPTNHNGPNGHAAASSAPPGNGGNTAAAGGGDGPHPDEIKNLEALRNKLIEVKTAVADKTAAFITEGTTVSSVVQSEIESLNKLKELLEYIQNILQVVFSSSNTNFGDINVSQDPAKENTVSSVITNIQSTLGQILSVLQGFTGLESDGKNAIKKKEPVADNVTTESKTAEHFASKLSDLATEGTLSTIKGAVEQIAQATQAKEDAEHLNLKQTVDTLVSALTENIRSIKDVMDGVVQYKKDEDNRKKQQDNNIGVDAQTKQAYDAMGKASKDASVKITKTGDQAIATSKKVGTEVAKVVETTSNGITSTVVSMSNANKLAMENTKEQFETFNKLKYFGTKQKSGFETDAQVLYSNYLDTYDKLQNAIKEYDKAIIGGQDTTAIQQNINTLQASLGNLERQLTAIANKSRAFMQNGTIFEHLDSEKIKKPADSLKQLVVQTESLAVAFRGVHDDGRKVIYDVLDNGVIKSFAIELDEATGNVRKMELSEYGLVNAMQQVNSAAKQRKELESILDQDNDVNKKAAIVKSYLQAKSDLDDKVQDTWTKAKQNGGVINQNDLDIIYAMSQEVMRLGTVVQSEYAKISKLKGSGGLFNKLGAAKANESLEDRMRRYMDDQARSNKQRITNVQYDSATKAMTADLVSLSGEITKVKLQYNELFDGIQTTSMKGTSAVDGIEQKIKSLKTSINDAMKDGLIDAQLQEYEDFGNAIEKLKNHIDGIQSGAISFDDKAIKKWSELRQTVIDTGIALQQVGEAKLAAKDKRLQEYQTNANKIFKGLDFDTTSATTDGQKKIVGIYDQIIEKIDLLKSSHSALTDQQTQEINTLVQSLKNEADAYTNATKSLSEVFKSSRADKLSKFDLDKAKLEKDLTSMPSGFDDRIKRARTAIENAVDNDSLKAAVNNWNALQNEIKQAAIEQDLYVKKSKEAKKTPVDDFSKKKTSQVNAFEEYKKGLKDVNYGIENLQDQLNNLDALLQQVGDQTGLDEWIAKFEKLKNSVSTAKAGFAASNNTIIDKTEKELVGSFNRLSKSQQDSLLLEYSKVIGLLKQQKKEVENGHAVELAGIKKITAALQEKINLQLAANKAEKESQNAKKKNAKFGDTKVINAELRYNALSNEAKEFANSSVIADKLNKYTDAYNALIAKKKALSSMGSISVTDEAEFNQLAKDCNEAALALDKIIKASTKLRGQSASGLYTLGDDFKDDKDSRIAAFTDFVNGIEGADAATMQFKNNWNEVVFVVKNSDGTFTQMTGSFTAARNEIVALAGDTKQASTTIGSFMNELKGKFKSIATYLMASVSFYEVWHVIKQGVGYVTEIDTALTELKKVTNETDATYANFLQSMSKTGAIVGATVTDLTTMAADWARLGYSIEEAGKLAESTAILLNVSEFDDATAASEALISTMQAFQYTADESQHVVDILNEVGKLLPVDNYIG